MAMSCSQQLGPQGIGRDLADKTRQDFHPTVGAIKTKEAPSVPTTAKSTRLQDLPPCLLLIRISPE